MRIEVSGLNGRTTWVTTTGTRVQELRGRIAAYTGVPGDQLRLKSGGRDLHDEMPLQTDFAVQVLLRVVGGKGGFGAMLRTAGKNGVKTTNFDACRDLNGRRLRHVNSETQLRQWEAKADERKRKKMEQLARNAPPKPEPPPRFDEDEYDEKMEATRKSVSEAVAAAVIMSNGGAETSGAGSAATEAEQVAAAVPLAGKAAGDASRNGKRRADESVPPAAKAAKLWADPLQAMLDGQDDDSSSSDGDQAAA